MPRVSYVDPYTQPWFMVANKSKDLLCIDFTKRKDLSRDGIENVLLLTDAFINSVSLHYKQSEGIYHCKKLRGQVMYIYSISS